VRYCRRSERQDIAFAALIVVHALADNDEGVCWISFGRLARLLGCSKRAIRGARERLEGLGLLLITEQAAHADRDNDTNLLRLAVRSRLASVRPLQVVEALSPASRPRGRPAAPGSQKRRKPDAQREEAGCQNGGNQTQAGERLASSDSSLSDPPSTSPQLTEVMPRPLRRPKRHLWFVD